MPLIVLSGQPCSGKSTIAAKLCELLQPAHPVHVVDEPSLHLERNNSYQSESFYCYIVLLMRGVPIFEDEAVVQLIQHEHRQQSWQQQ
jgi:adenylate kinase family enzyme